MESIDDRIDRLEGQMTGLLTVVALMLQRSPEAREEVRLMQVHQTILSTLLREGVRPTVATAAQESLARVMGQDA